MARNLILDVDTGTDDATAIIAAALSPALKLLGVMTEWGTNTLENTTRNTLQVLDLLKSPVPVYAGCPGPMTRTLYHAYDADQHQKQSVDENGKRFGYHDDFPLPPPLRNAEPLHAVTWLIETLRAATERVTLVACGPLTSIGCALRIAPEIAGKLEEIVIMGGGIQETNITLAAEANIWRDPEAAAITLACGAPVTMIPLDATHSAALPEKYVGLFAALGTPTGDFFSEMLRRRIRVYNALQPLKRADVAPIHDALCVAYLLDPEVITDLRTVHLEICLDHGAGAGAFLVDTRHNHKPANVSLAYDADPERFGGLLLSLVSESINKL